MAKKTKAEKVIDDRINNAYISKCKGIQIGVMDMGGVFKVGKKAIEDGADDNLLAEKIFEYVQTIRKN